MYDPDPGAWMDGFWLRNLLEPPARGPVAFGGTLTPADLLAAHSTGLLPMPSDTAEDAQINEVLYADNRDGIRFVGARGRSYGLAWWSPDPRPVLTPDCVRIGAGLTGTLRSRRHWTTTVDRAFGEVLSACRADREPRWLTDQLVAAMTELHSRGWYHSVEVWSDARLVGGAVGLGRGAVLSADTMFHRESGASRIALVDLVTRLMDTPTRVLDLQWDSPHARRLGATLMARREYVELVARSTERIAVPTAERSVSDLLNAPTGRGRA
jgi:leucyl/phenylalanyl-tRNA--protein transferase